MESDRRWISEHDYLESQISLEQTRLLYGGLKFSLAASFVCAVIMVIALYDHAHSRTNLELWAAAMLFMFSMRTLDAYHFITSSPEKQASGIWKLRFMSGALLGGILWGLLAWMGDSPKDEFQAIIVMCVVGVCAGSLSSLSFNWRALVLFIMPATTLLAINLALREGNFAHITSIILVFFIIFTIMSGIRIYENTHQNIRLRIEADHREVTLELMHQKQLLHYQQTPLAIIEFDLDLHVTDWNKAAENIFGYRKHEAIGRNIIQLIVPESSMGQVEELWMGVLELQPVIGQAIENHTRDGKSITCEWYITPLTKNDDEIVGVAAMALDISEKKHFEQELVDAKNDSERANQAKSDFLSNMSHELRTPLNAILGFTQLLKVQTELDGKQEHYINEIDNAGQLQLELVNQILDLSQIERGHLAIDMESVSVRELINECERLISPLASKDDIYIQVGEIKDRAVHADYTRLKQVLINLLSNAIKYNRHGGSVDITCDNFHDAVRISITDTGPGLSDAQMKDIFKPFNRLGVNTDVEGTGIGLSISKQLIERMDGTIGVNSILGNGCTFWVELRRSALISSTHHADAIRNDHLIEDRCDANHDIRILVAEDNPINQTLIINQLNTLGYTADLVENGVDALERLDGSSYDVLFTDCNMPVMDGYELAREIRKRGDDSISIIAITADAFPEKERECLEAGMNGRITKPVDLDTLSGIINRHLSQQTRVTQASVRR